MDAELQKLFDAYEKAYSALDLETTATFFADTFISAGPKGTLAQSKKDFGRWAKEAADFYRKMGLVSGKILSTKELSLAEHHVLVTVHWGVWFHKTGETPIEFDVSYMVDKTGPDPKIVMFVAHQDEEEAMKKLAAL
jgi:hypothetical protein